MEKIEEITTIKTVVHRYCDDCGKELHWDLACSVAECGYCGKQLCKDCIGHERETSGDYREVYCKSCSAIYRKYKSEIDAAHEKYCAILTKMRAECKSYGNIESKDSKK
jgi:hypothetical protein